MQFNLRPNLRLVGNTNERAALTVYAVCFLAGFSTHTMDIVRGGWLPYRIVPLGINVFWSLLTMLDLLTVLLLFGNRKLGLMLAAGIMVVDVVVNSYVMYCLDLPFQFWPLQLQTLFCGFVLGSLPILWPATARVEL
jgi:hypothetical protein